MFPLSSRPPGIVIAAPRSGSGKTTVTLGLLRALRRRGLIIQPYKCGPDYIDPAFHEAACGRPSYNLDSWAMRRETAFTLLGAAAGADFVIVEAAMGLFDGVATMGGWGNGASADAAALTGLPVVIVLDISGQSQTAAPTVRGFAGFRPGVEILGAILNRVASARHEKLARSGFEEARMQILGAIPRKDTVFLPERHLGLVQAGEISGLSASLDALADLIEANIDVEALLNMRPSQGGAQIASLPAGQEQVKGRLMPPAQRIALARDAAFSFVYPHLLKAWREAGAEIVPFSPLADEAPDFSTGMVWLPGGYPELHAGRLASNDKFMDGIRSFAKNKPVHGECGGYMVLGKGLIDAKGERHAMAGLLPLETSFASRKLHLGYRRAALLRDCVLGKRGEVLSGHEFHYSSVITEQGEALFSLFDAEASPLPSGGLTHDNVSGSFLHFIDRWTAD